MAEGIRDHTGENECDPLTVGNRKIRRVRSTTHGLRLVGTPIHQHVVVWGGCYTAYLV